jgi:hypothetical protein
MILFNLPKNSGRDGKKIALYVIENARIVKRWGVVRNCQFCYSVSGSNRHAAIGGLAFTDKQAAERKLAVLTVRAENAKTACHARIAYHVAKGRKPIADELFSQFVKLFSRRNRAQKQANAKPHAALALLAQRKLIRAKLADFQ